MKKLDKKIIEDIFALTPMQEGMLFHYLKAPGSGAYFEQLSLGISGKIDTCLFEKAWDVVIQTNEMLRAVFRWEKVEQPIQIILKVHRLQSAYYDFSRTTPREIKNRLEEFKTNDRKKKFDLRNVPFRVTLCKIEEDKYEMIISNHHILYDGWSSGIILKEFFKAYTDLSSGKGLIKPVKAKFKEFVIWQQEEDQEGKGEFWRDYLRGFDTPKELSVKQANRKEHKRSENFRTTFKKNTREQMERFINRHKLTMAALLYSAWGLLLQKYNNSDDVISGTTVSGRSPNIKGIENIVGLFINTIPLRIKTLPGEKTVDLCKRINETLQVRKAYESSSLVKIKEYSQLNHNEALFDSIVVIENYPLDELLMKQKGELSINSYSIYEMTHYDLTVGISSAEEIEVSFIYNKELFEESGIRGLSCHFTTILKDILENPGKEFHEIDILSQEEKRQILIDFNDTDAAYPMNKTLLEFFEDRVEETPGNIALTFQGKALTYKGFNKKTDHLAFLLRAKGIKFNNIVGVMTERSMEMLIGIFGIMKAGGAYLPIDPNSPLNRIRYQLKDSSSKLLLTRAKFIELAETIDFDGEVINLDNESIYRGKSEIPGTAAFPMDLAYIIYTSGSTGQPKGVMIEHVSVVNLLLTLDRLYPLGEFDAYLLKTSFMFDVSVSELFGWYWNGGRLAILKPGAEKDPLLILDALEEEKITHLNFVPSMFNLFVDALNDENAAKISNLRYIFLAGEAIRTDSIVKFRALNSNVIIENLYGPTEATIYASWYPAAKWNGEGSVSIGKPIDNLKLYIVDRSDNSSTALQPVGVPGELLISGIGAARGYLNQPELTAEKFIPNSIAQKEGTQKEGWSDSFNKLYRTGDLTRWDDNGDIEYLGRIDHQVKIRGFRIETGEIENILSGQEEIKEALVIARDDRGGEKYLCAYLVAEEELDTSTVRDKLEKELPGYMIPSYFVQLEQIPLTPGGKVNRAILPLPTLRENRQDYAAPRNKIEKKLVGIWSGILGLEKEKIGIDHNFIELGGHSLKATRLVSRIHKELNIKMSLPQLFKFLTIRELALYMTELEISWFSPVKAAEKKEWYALSSAQKRLYILHRMDGKSTVYNMPAAVLLEGELKKEKLEGTFRKLIKRHESLRTSFQMINGSPVQKIHDRVDFEIVDYSTEHGAPNVEGSGARPTSIIRNFIRPFDLSRAPLMRVGLVEPGEEKYLLILDIHHIISDGISIGILMRDFMGLYEGKTLPPLTLNYKDSSENQYCEKEKEEIKTQRDFWINEFKGDIPVLDLPIDGARAAVQSFEGSQVNFQVGAEETRALKKLALEEDVTFYVVLLAIFNIFLSKVCNQEDIIVGTPTAGRRHADLEQIIGMFVNTLALRNHPSGEKTFKEFLNEVKKRTLQSFENQEYQYEDLVEQVVLNRDAGRNPLFDVMFVMQNIDIEINDMKIPGLNLAPYPYDREVSRFDLTLSAVEEQEELGFQFEYGSKLFKESTIQRFINYFKKVVSVVAGNREIKLSEIEVISEEEKIKLLYEFNNTESGYPEDKTIHELFEAQVKAGPDRVALQGIGNHLTYRELNLRSNQPAWLLREKGVSPDTIIGLMVEPSSEMIIGMLAVLKAGGAYLPIDPDYPEERNRFILKDSGVEILLTTKPVKQIESGMEVIHLEEDEIYRGDYWNLTNVNTPGNLAYTIYTSGTTGKPKGAIIEHRNVVRLMINERSLFNFHSRDTWTMFHSYCFDFSVWEMYGALLYGGKLVLIPRVTARDPRRYVELLKKEAVTVLNQTPTIFYNISDQELNAPGKQLNLRYVIFGGEALKPGKLKEWREKYPETKLINMFGITETTVHVTYKEITGKEIESNVGNIGVPIPTLTAYIMDSYRNLVPTGVPGEICVGGEGPGRGYLNRPELTHRKFTEVPYIPGKRMYRSGDLGRLLTNGEMVYLGRIDHQVKIRGFRIELGEIENQLLRHDAVHEAIVVASEDNKGDKYLCGYMVADSDLSMVELREYLAMQLPDYMLPSYFVRLAKIPVTPNGKVDRRALPKPETGRTGGEYTAPRDEIEAGMAAIWEEELRVHPLGIDDNFFDVGGHSLKAVQLVSRIHKTFGVEIRIQELFQYPTIAEVAQLIRERRLTHFSAIDPLPRQPHYELSYPQKRLWYIYKREPNSGSFNMPVKITLYEAVDENIVKAVLKKLLARHESLRTSFKEIDKSPVQVIEPAEQPGIKFKSIDLCRLDTVECEKERERLLIEESSSVFNLDHAPLFRVKLIKCRDREFDLVFNAHHIISDGWSMEVLREEFNRLYESYKKGDDCELEPLKIQYKDYAAWQNRLLANEEAIEKAKKFWKKQLRGSLPVLNLPYDVPPSLSVCKESAAYCLAITDDLTYRLRQMARDYHASLFIVLLAGFNLFLSRVTGQNDVIMAIPAAARQHESLKRVIGMFVNTLLLRTDINPDETFLDFFKRFQADTFQVLEYQSCPMELICFELKIKYPAINVFFNMVNIGDTHREIAENFEDHHIEKVQDTKFDLVCYLREYKNGIEIESHYYKDLFMPESLEKIMNLYLKMLEKISHDPGKKIGEYSFKRKRRELKRGL